MCGGRGKRREGSEEAMRDVTHKFGRVWPLYVVGPSAVFIASFSAAAS